jgi:hypothetical protein
MESITGVCDFSTSPAGAWSRLFIYKFPRKVRSVGACITGFDAEFPDADHHLKDLWVDLSPFFIGFAHDEILYVMVTLGLEDENGYENLYSGQVRYCVFVELDRPAPQVLEVET